MNRPIRFLAPVALLVCIVAAACTGGGKGGSSTVRISGAVRDWRSGAAIPNASLRTVGILPQRTGESIEDGTFVLEDIPINGYVILDVSAVGYRRTIAPAILVEEANLADVVVLALADVDATAMRSGFGVTTSSGRGTILGRTYAPSGSGIPGVAAIQVLPVSVVSTGPFFLDAANDPAPGALATTSSGGFVFFNVSTGDVAVEASAPGLVFEPTASFISDSVWSIVNIPGDGPGVGGSPTPTPTGTPGPQSFSNDIHPIFQARGCNGSGCHKTGNAAAGFRLDQQPSQIYPNVAARCNTADPAASLLLIKPLFEATPNHGGGNIFLTTSDPDYQKILRWITDGAPNN